MNNQVQNTRDEGFQLLRASAEGDRQAFHELYNLTHKKVYAYLMRLLQADDLADDILVETYTQVWVGAAKFRGDSQPSTWIIGIARNLAMNSLKRRKYYDNIDDHEQASSQDETVEQNEVKEIMHTAIQQLPENHREILGLILLPEFSYIQVSQLLNIPINTVKSRLFNAKNALKKQLDLMGINRDVI
ncbi:MAG: sigma-70 family RNA polymerase sigma factor [Candidatus Brocadiaceae bacterium]|nr:sigma-70 family RNA polymerase sigma factor [Candidatus Brocadiaceae bacterium]